MSQLLPAGALRLKVLPRAHATTIAVILTAGLLLLAWASESTTEPSSDLVMERAPLPLLGPAPTDAHSVSPTPTSHPGMQLASIDVPAPRTLGLTANGPAGRPTTDLPTAFQPSTRPREHMKVRRGDSLATMFTRVRLSARDLANLTASTDAGKRLRKIHPGQELSFLRDDKGRLELLHIELSRLHHLTYYREPEGYGYRLHELKREPDRLLTSRHATIEQSLFQAGLDAKLSDKDIMNLAGIFQWDIDFVLDLRAGDTFSVLLEELYLDGEQIGTGAILAAEFSNQGDHHRAVRWEDPDGNASYFSPDGRSMRKAFLRAPVKFSRISSNFNPRRLHPILKRVVPHRGIDYAAPSGTPIFAAGDGTITTAGNNRTAGRHIEIRHGEQYRTRYLHMSRLARGMKRGKKVRQGQTIGYVGSSGRATGPHLHYEFLVHGAHRNPRTVSMPKAEPIPRAQLALFKRDTQPLLLALGTTPARSNRDGLFPEQMAAGEE